MSDKRCCCRLTFGAGHGDNRRLAQPVSDFDLAVHRDISTLDLANQRAVQRNARREDSAGHVGEFTDIFRGDVLRPHRFKAGNRLGELSPRFFVDRIHLGAAPAQNFDDGFPAAPEPDD